MTENAIRAAMFVDFDAVFGAIHGEDRQAADQFGKRPGEWLRYFAEGRHAPANGVPLRPRALLLLTCYLNPEGVIERWKHIGQFGGYREYFVRAGFTVVDCPKLTTEGKNAADIRMVIDVLDALAYRTPFDEFILLSADADLTPLVQRLRANDRRTTVLATASMAAALRSSCDRLVPAAELIAALGPPRPDPVATPPRPPASAPAVSVPVPPPPPPAPVPSPVLDAAALRAEVLKLVRETLRPPLGWRLLSQVEAGLRKRLPQLAETGWPGGGSLEALLRGTADPFISLWQRTDGETVVHDKRIWRPQPGPAESASRPLAETILAAIADIVAGEREPLALPDAEVLLRQRLRIDAWPAGADSLLAFLREQDVAVLEVDPGFLFDPARHAPLRLRTAAGEGITTLSGPARALIELVCRDTGCPALPPEAFPTLFQAIAAHAGAPEAVAEACRQAGVAIEPASVTYVLDAVRDTAAGLEGEDAARALAAAYAESLAARCAERGPALSEAERTLLRLWVGAEG